MPKDTIRAEPNRRFTKVGVPIPVSGQYDLTFFCADVVGTFYVKMISIEETTPPENKPVAERWWKWDSEPTTTLTQPVPEDGVVTVTVGGTAQEGNIWGAAVVYDYTVEAGKKYKYTFEAWTDSGTYTLHFGTECCWHDINLTTTNDTTFTLVGNEMSGTGVLSIMFPSADVLGTFYIGVIDIEETTDAPTAPTP